MKDIETKIIVSCFITMIFILAIANILEFGFMEFYFMLVMMFYLLKYIYIKIN